jgi:hypothetical protein
LVGEPENIGEIRMLTSIKAWLRHRRYRRIADEANSLLVRICTALEAALTGQYGDEAGKIAAGITNKIIHFGWAGYKAVETPTIGERIDREFDNAWMYLTQSPSLNDYRSAITALVIFNAAMDRVPIEAFKSHMKHLYSEALADIGPLTPDVRPILHREDWSYYVECAALSDEHIDEVKRRVAEFAQNVKGRGKP